MNQIAPIRRQNGFTLVESMLTLLLGGILLTVGIPAMLQLAAANRITSELNMLSNHMHLARSEAVKRRYRAVICPSRDGNSCLGSRDWQQGYMLFIDKDADRRHDSDEPVIRHHRLDTNTLRIDAGRRRTVAYQATGWAPGSNLTITLCDPRKRAAPKALVISMSGRPRVTDIHPNGSPLKCS